MEREEEYRNKWALGLTVTLSVVIFVSFAFYKGYFNLGGNNVASKSQMASVVSAESVSSPIQNTKKTFGAAFDEINKQYKQFTDSVSSVLVPFVTGIEVYQRK
jgi:hypothetical protein